jgi:phage terminase large subunit
VHIGINAVRALISPASGPPRLFIHSRCTQLINDLLNYRYDPDRPHSDTPSKDGPDHGCDALRYLVMVAQRRPFETRRTVWGQ